MQAQLILWKQNPLRLTSWNYRPLWIIRQINQKNGNLTQLSFPNSQTELSLHIIASITKSSKFSDSELRFKRLSYFWTIGDMLVDIWYVLYYTKHESHHFHSGKSTNYLKNITLIAMWFIFCKNFNNCSSNRIICHINYNLLCIPQGILCMYMLSF